MGLFFSASRRVCGTFIPDDSVGSLAKLLCNGVALINNEVLVEHLEDFAALKVSHNCGDGYVAVSCPGGVVERSEGDVSAPSSETMSKGTGGWQSAITPNKVRSKNTR